MFDPSGVGGVGVHRDPGAASRLAGTCPRLRRYLASGQNRELPLPSSGRRLGTKVAGAKRSAGPGCRPPDGFSRLKALDPEGYCYTHGHMDRRMERFLEAWHEFFGG